MIYVVPTTLCPDCGQTMVSEENVILLRDGEYNNRPVYEFDLAEEMQALPFVCKHCGKHTYIKGTVVRHDNGEEVHYS